MTIEKQPLYVLSRSGQQSFCVYSLERPEPESSHPMPALGFGEERLDPHLPLAQGLLASLGLVVVPDSLKVVLIEAATQEATAVAVGAFALQRGGVAYLGVGPVLGYHLCVGVADVAQLFAAGADVEVSFLIVAEVLL